MTRLLRHILKRLAELVTDANTGRLSHTKLWPNIANAAATVVFLREGWDHRLTPEVWGSSSRRWAATRSSCAT